MAMNKSTLTLLTVAFALGLGSIYAVWEVSDSSAANHSSATTVMQRKDNSSGLASNKSKDVVNINPFGR
jgi:hypothetical protein